MATFTLATSLAPQIPIIVGRTSWVRASILLVKAALAKPVSRKAMEACLQRLFEPAAATQGARQPESAVLVTDAGGGFDGERKLALTHVPAGAELARDILFSNGRLLLRTGTRLSERGRDRLNELLTMAGVPTEVWIRTSP